MALTPIQQVRLLIGLTASSPFIDLVDLTDEEIQWFLDHNGGSVIAAAKMAAIAVSFQVTGINTREITGDIHVYNDLSSQYLKALDNFIKDASAYTLPNGLMPYAAGISWQDVCDNNNTPDNVRPALSKIQVCDGKGLFYSDPFNSESCGC
tara:strand:- start:65531 stop:65983 length:453 start_codon:yes stop_codon:yes gene_type:complete